MVPYILCLLVGLGFAGWVLIIKWAGITSAWGTIIVMTFATLTVAMFNAPTLPELPTPKQILYAIAGGTVFNGVALIAFNVIITNPLYADTNFPAIANVLFLAFLAMGWIALGDQEFNSDTVIGIVAACFGAYFLSR
jgi:hypothetical protein